MAKKSRGLATQSSQQSEPASPATESQSVVGSPTSALKFTSGAWEAYTDPLKDLEKPIPGWPLVSKLIAKYPDLEAFKVFRDLNIKSLLYYQAELQDLQMKLHKAEHHEYRMGEQEGIERASMMAENHDYYLYHARKDDQECKSKQIKIMKQIRVVLKDYNDALLQYSQVAALPNADPYNVETLRVWLKRVGNHCISGPAACVWGDYTEGVRKPKSFKSQFASLLRSIFWPPASDPNTLDLVVPRQGHKVDGLTKWVANEFVPLWHGVKQALRYKIMKTSSAENRLPTTETKSQTPRSICSWFRHRKKSTGALDCNQTSKDKMGLTVYSEARMLRFTSAVATIIACLLPTVAIAVLSSLQSTGELLGVIAAFTTIFAMGLMFLTDAATSRVQIFTATAAFSAVMVVFVQNQNVYVGYDNSPGRRIMNGTNPTNG